MMRHWALICATLVAAAMLLLAFGAGVFGRWLLRDEELVFQYRTGFDEDWDIYLMDVGRGLIAPFYEVNSDANEYQPSWSSDGTRLLFVSERDGNREIYHWDEYSGIAKLTNNILPDLDPHWSPDGRQIVFTSYQHENNFSQIYLINADGSERRFFTAYSSMNPTWSPDGTEILFTSFQNFVPRVSIVKLDGSERRDLSNVSVTGEINPIWSPDGRRIAYLRTPSNQAELYVMNSDGSDAHSITAGFNYIADPAWSPDGRRIAFTRGGSDIYIVNADGTEFRRLTISDAYYLALGWRP